MQMSRSVTRTTQRGSGRRGRGATMACQGLRATVQQVTHTRITVTQQGVIPVTQGRNFGRQRHLATLCQTDIFINLLNTYVKHTYANRKKGQYIRKHTHTRTLSTERSLSQRSISWPLLCHSSMPERDLPRYGDRAKVDVTIMSRWCRGYAGAFSESLVFLSSLTDISQNGKRRRK